MVTKASPTTTDEASMNGHAHNGDAAPGGKRRRATAESMAAKQKEISVSEFFAKNRHLLGFDNPRKALLTTVKEAVDNSLDACEEAGITPEIWVEIEAVGNSRYRASIQDNGPGIMKKTIPLIFGKLLYGSKFHRLRMSRGQQGIGISAAGMYGMLTTGKPVKIVSKLSPKKPIHYYEIQIDTKRNHPEILNGKGEGEDIVIPAKEEPHAFLQKKGIDWHFRYPVVAPPKPQIPEDEPFVLDASGKSVQSAPAPQVDESGPEVNSGTRVTIELEAKFHRGRGSVEEYLEQTAIANPHVTLHYKDPDGAVRHYVRSTEQLPPEPKEIKPHPYGIELGRLVTMLKDSQAGTLSQFLTDSFSRVSSDVARRICEVAAKEGGAKITTRSHPKRIGRQEADALYQAIQSTKISAPSTDCISPIGEELLIKGLYQVVPGEFYCAATRPPSVYRGNPFQIEVALAYGGASPVQKVTLEALKELLSETDARTLRQFLLNTFDGLGGEGSDKIIEASGIGTRQSPGKLSAQEKGRLYEAMRNVNLSEGSSMQVLRYANRVPLQFQPAACAVTQSVVQTNWRAYGLNQSRGNMPSGPVTVMVHMASVWVPFTSESKEAIASYPEIQKELRLGLQAVGRKLGMFLNRRNKVKQEGERRSIFLRYLKEVAEAVHVINDADTEEVYEGLLRVAKKKTAEADMKLDDRGKKIDPQEEDFGGSVLIVKQEE